MSSNPFWDQQQQLLKMWNENIKKLPGVEVYENMYKNMIPNAAEYWNKFSESVADTPWGNFAKLAPSVEDYWKSFPNFVPNSETFSKLWGGNIPGMEVFEKVFEFWKSIGDPATFLKDYQEKYMDMMQDLFKSLLPAGSAQFFEKPTELMKTCVAFYQNIFGPWMQIDQDILQRIATGDVHAFFDFSKEFSNKYEESFEKVFNMMGLGLNRESNEEQMKAIGGYIKMLFSAVELSALVSESWGKSLQTLVERYQSDLQEGKAVTTFREFYNLWFDVTEEALLTLFNTDEFAKAFGNFSDKYAKYMIAINKVYERSLSALPIPTNKDMTSLYRTVYDLRKEVRDLRRELDALKTPAASK